MTAFDVKTVGLNGLNLIEASAGTGKTSTLAELYLHLIVERELQVDQILVVTYTRAATQELHDRLRQKLVKARDTLVLSQTQHNNLFHRLNLAIQSFDEAAIYTIHSFSQRVLMDYAFEGGLPFELELVGDETELLLAATDDFWRRQLAAVDAGFSAYLLDRKISPESLLQSIRTLIGKPYLRYHSLPEFNAEQSYQTLQQQFELVKRLWHTQKDKVVAALNDKNLLNGNKYRSNWVENWLLKLMQLCRQNTVPIQLFEQFDRFTPARLKSALNNEQTLPELEFWTACEQLLERHQEMIQTRALQLQQTRLQLLFELQHKLPQIKQQQQMQSHDDVLLNLQAALTSEQGETLVEKLRAQYPAALIDEFQDTDPVQYASFSRIYARTGLPVFFVGDPKQAIYSFRGADIFTYLSARETAENRHTLGRNWRSHPLLVKAVNTLFERAEQPFIYEWIPFYPVAAARSDEAVLQCDGQQMTPMELIWCDGDEVLNKKEMTQLAAENTANQIAQLFTQARTGQLTLTQTENGQKRPLSGGDIAVLVRSHHQAANIQAALIRHGINSVQQGRDNVFASSEAIVMLRLMQAVNEPNQDRLITAVLTTPLFAVSASDLYDLQQNEQDWSAYADLFHSLQQTWIKQGFLTMFRQLLSHRQQQRMLAQAGGERQITNLLHLAELIQEYCNRDNSNIDATIQWFNRQRMSGQTEQESAQIRLESDEELVKIITIHKSKGLEYPIVFCPFLWDVKQQSSRDEIICYHDKLHHYAASVALAEPYLSQAQQGVEQEQKSEESRLLYVALTRARERCVVFWGMVKGVEQSALFRLLHPQQAETAQQRLRDLQSLTKQYADSFSLKIDQQQSPLYMKQQQQASSVLEPRLFNARIPRPWRIGSFSSLTAGRDAELPDYDATTSLQRHEPVAQFNTKMDRFAFPRGAQAGCCLHSILEHWDFRDETALEKLVSKQLSVYGFDEKWQSVVMQWLQEVVATPVVASGLSLNQLTPAQRLNELAFYFPALVLVAELKQQLEPYVVADALLEKVIMQLSCYDLSGFIKGFVDLVFEHQGQFFVVDYKSNYLGSEPQDYSENALNTAMIEHNYPLQYLIYTLALHRYLSLRLPDYDPQQHLGGVAYLFIRGMKPDWSSSGVFFTRLDVPLVLAVDALVKGEQP